MKNSGFSRIWFFVILFAAIVTAHIIILRLVVNGGKSAPPPMVSAAEASVRKPDAEVKNRSRGEAVRNPEKAAASRNGGEKPSLWRRIFGGGKKTDESSASSAPASKPHPPLRLRNRKPSDNPNFGAPLDFSRAIHGELSEQQVPGSGGARSGIVVDMDSRRVLWEKNSSRAVPVASMVKMMTMLLVAEELERNDRLTLDTRVTITRTVMKVERTGLLWLTPGEVFTLRELMLGIAVKSANDAATQVAEVVAGDVDAFVARMNARARELNLPSMKFYNPCGLPDRRGRNGQGSAADMVLLGERLLEYPFLMEMCSTLKGSIREGDKKTIFVNTNRLINPHYPGVDGLKTGFIKKSGFCLTFSALRDGRRIMGCVTGFKTARDRDRFCRRLIDWAYKQPRQ